MSPNLDTLSCLIRAALAETPDPRQAAAKVVAGLDYDERAELFPETLPYYVRDIIHRDRMQTAPSRPMDPESSEASQSESSKAESSQPGPSKAKLCRDWWAAQLAQPAFALGDWLHYGKFTRAHVLGLVRDRRADSDKLLAKADHYQSVHDVMVATGADLVEDIPRDQIPAAWQIAS